MPIPQETSLYLFNGSCDDETGSHDGMHTDVTYDNGIVDQAAVLNGTTSKVDLGTDFLGTGDLTISAWIYLNGWGENGFGRIIDNGTFQFYSREGTTSLACWGADGTAFSGTIATDQWLYVVVTRAADGTVNFYVNGELSGSADQSTGTPTAGTTNVFIGNNAAGSRTFDGLIDGLRIFTGTDATAITPGMIKRLATPTEATLASSYTMSCDNPLLLPTMV